MPIRKFQLDGYVTVDELAKKLSVKPITIYKWIERGHLKPERMGWFYFIPKKQADKFLKIRAKED